MRRKKNVGAKKSVIFRVALLLFAVYTIYSMISLQAELAENKKILAQKQALITQKQISNDDLKYLLEKGSEKDLIERAARDKLDYVYQNEEVYEDISGK
ncbi:MAG: septum formation initiator family protein [Clostridia bacterium]|nr:septum formation initiator family protein [Clostridia bacterium]